MSWAVLALGPDGSAWVQRLAAWAAAPGFPLDVRAVRSGAEVRAALAGARPASAVLVDGAAPDDDRDSLLGLDCPVVVVHADGPARWWALGPAAVLPEDFGPAALVDVLLRTAPPVAPTTAVPGDPDPGAEPRWATGRLVAVCGPGGTGATTVATALAQGLAAGGGSGGFGPPLLLADLCRRGDLAVLCDARHELVGIQELVDAHRSEAPPESAVRAHCLPMPLRGHDVLLGLRDPRAWTALRPRAVEAALAGMRRAYATVVADVEGEVEGEGESGSLDLEERHALARTPVLRADLVLAVGGPGLLGTHALVRLVHELTALGVPGHRILPVVNRAPSSAGSRAELTEALALLCAADDPPAPPLLLPPVDLDRAERSGEPLPHELTERVATAVTAVHDHAALPLDGVLAGAGDAPRRVRPGLLGLAAEPTW